MIDRIKEMDVELAGGRRFSVVSAEANRARNALKHATDPDEDTVTIEPGEATAMLARALVNYNRLGGALSPAMVLAFERIQAEISDDTRRQVI